MERGIYERGGRWGDGTSAPTLVGTRFPPRAPRSRPVADACTGSPPSRSSCSMSSSGCPIGRPPSGRGEKKRRCVQQPGPRQRWGRQQTPALPQGSPRRALQSPSLWCHATNFSCCRQKNIRSVLMYAGCMSVRRGAGWGGGGGGLSRGRRGGGVVFAAFAAGVKLAGERNSAWLQRRRGEGCGGHSRPRKKRGYITKD